MTQEKQLSSEVAESSEFTFLEEEVRRLREESASLRAQNAGLQGQLAERDNAASLLLSCSPFVQTVWETATDWT